MSSALWVACAIAISGCVHTEQATERVDPCPSAIPEYVEGDLGPSNGAQVERVCIVGAKPRAAVALRDLVKEREGATLDALAVRQDIHTLVESGLISDVRVIALRIKNRRAVTLLYAVKEYARLADVIVEGNPTADVWQVIAQPYLFEASGRPFSTPKFRRLLGLLAEAYANAGYPHAKVASEVEPLEQGEVRVRVKIYEGAQSLVRAVRVEGAVRMSEIELLKGLSTEVGKSYSAEALERDAALMAERYFERGMINAAVLPVPIPETDGTDWVAMTFKIHEGDVFRVGDVKMIGLSLGSEPQTLKKIEMGPGEVFSRSSFARDIKLVESRVVSKGGNIEVVPRLDQHPALKTVDITYSVEVKP